MSRPRRATVWWRDAWSDNSSQERDAMARFHRPLLLGKTGWVVVDDEVGVSISPEWTMKDGENEGQGATEFRGQQFVPRGMIERVEYLDP